MNKGAVAAMFDGEYAAFLELARGLTDEEWNRPSLCEDWTVGDVVLHVAYHTRKSVLDSFRSGSKVVVRMVADEHAETRHGLLAWLARPVPEAARNKDNLAELVIHSQDIRRALGIHHVYPSAVMRLSLDKCVTAYGTIFIVGRIHRVAKGLHLTATDLDWSYGSGPEVTGTAEAILMAIAARPAALDDLSGAGVATLARRLGSVVGRVAS
jgi:uncharacterized protein (TIGR03083 family)